LNSIKYRICGDKQCRAFGAAISVRVRPETHGAREPTASLDPSAAQLIRAKIKRLGTEDQCGILWTSHNMNEVEAVCDRVLFLSRGKVLLAGSPRTLPHEHGSATLEDLFIRVAREPLKAIPEVVS
jgi:ABC-2 type transport system ATP-binding protein